ncbi:putative F-box protein At3g52320 [Prosopis cineraria]|uniref:putative F-box protein At3g52320 n=1 Tax=Prosopis cineraria TaxID=364024 RepID=UPI00240EF21A|nr:putative F-box protein At3g52320 [Prosopis cineraria]
MATSKVKKQPVIMEEHKMYLPQELTISILKRLPVKSLLRFQCVCKFWKDLIKMSFFTQRTFPNSTHHQGPFLLLHWEYFPFDHMQFDLLHSDKKTLQPLHAPSITDLFTSQVRVIGSSNGVLCYYVKLIAYENKPVLLSETELCMMERMLQVDLGIGEMELY